MKIPNNNNNNINNNMYRYIYKYQIFFQYGPTIFGK